MLECRVAGNLPEHQFCGLGGVEHAQHYLQGVVFPGGSKPDPQDVEVGALPALVLVSPAEDRSANRECRAKGEEWLIADRCLVCVVDNLLEETAGVE